MKENMLEVIRASAFLLLILGVVIEINVLGWKLIAAGYLILTYSLFGYLIKSLEKWITK